MLRPREEVEGRRLAQRIAQLGEAQHVARKRRRLAGDVDHALRGHGADGAHRILPHALARRIDDHDLGAQPARGERLRGLARVGADKFRILHTVCRGVGPGVFDGLGHDLRADDPTGLAGETQADRPGTAVEVEGQPVRSGRGVFQSLVIQPLGLRRIDLKEGLRRDVKGKATERVRDMPLAPERIKIPGEHGVSRALVHVQHDPRQLRARAAQSVDQRPGQLAEAAPRHDAQQAVETRDGAAAEDVPHDAAPGRLVISGDGMHIHKVRERMGRAVRQLVLQQAAFDRDQLMAALAVEAGDGTPVLLPDGEDALVAVALGLPAPDDLGGGHALFSDAGERVVDFLKLEAQLLVIVHVPAVAAAAAAVAGAVGGDAGGGGDEQFFPAPVGEARADLDDADLPDLARQGARHKDRAAPQMCDARSVGGEALDRDRGDLIFSQRFHIFNNIIYKQRRQNFLNNLSPIADAIFV